MLSVFGRGGIPSEATQNLLKTFSEKSKSDSVKGISTMTLASYLRNGKSMLGSLIENPRFAEAYPDSMDYFKKLAATKDEDVENLLKTAAEKYADVEHRRIDHWENGQTRVENHRNTTQFASRQNCSGH